MISTTGSSTVLACILPIIVVISVLPRFLKIEHELFRQARLAKSVDSRPCALVTASSAGIGYGIAHELCRSGFNVIIHGRDRKQLEIATKQLQKAFANVLVESICFDTSSSLLKDDLGKDLREILKPLTTRNIRLLVNNVGTGFNPKNNHDFALFSEHSREHITEILDVNVRFSTYLTWYFLKQLEVSAREAGNHSIVLNISSVADMGIPWLAVYSASKAYTTCFTKALDTEMKGDKIPIDVKAAIPGSVDSPNCRMGVSFTCPSSDQMGKEIVDTIKNARSSTVTYPNWGHWLQTIFCVIQPYWVLQKVLTAGVQDAVKYREEVKFSEYMN